MPEDVLEINHLLDYVKVTMKIMEKIEQDNSTNKKRLKYHVQTLIFKFIGAFRQIEQFQIFHDREIHRGIIMEELVDGKHVFLSEAYSIDSFHYYVKSCIDMIPRILSFYYYCINKNWTISRKGRAFIRELGKHDNPVFKRILQDYYKWMHGIAVYRDYSTHRNLIISDVLRMTVPNEEGRFNYFLGLPVLDVNGEGKPVRQRYEYRGRHGQIKTCDKTAPAGNIMVALFLALQDLLLFLFKQIWGLKIDNSQFVAEVIEIESRISALECYVLRVRQ